MRAFVGGGGPMTFRLFSSARRVKTRPQKQWPSPCFAVPSLAFWKGQKARLKGPSETISMCVYIYIPIHTYEHNKMKNMCMYTYLYMDIYIYMYITHTHLLFFQTSADLLL